jgi:hypothetical protein
LAFICVTPLWQYAIADFEKQLQIFIFLTPQAKTPMVFEECDLTKKY